MGEAERCVGCGAEIPAGRTSNGLCPTFLLKLGVGPSGADVPGDDDSTTSGLPHRRSRGDGRRMIPEGQQFGPYRVERLLGKGGMGEVYEAVDESGRRLALKVLTHGLDDPEDRARFLREGRLAASINHPHTVYVYGTEEIEGVPVIAMELASGGSLKDRLKADGPLAPTDAVDTILQVIAGLEAAAAVGVLHRDVKPSNCFVDGAGQVKVGDFGLSISTLARAEHDLTELTMTGAFMGTPAFASPEQLRADDLDVRSDIYAVGATLYYLLTGHAPFEETNILKLATMIAQEPPRPLAELRPDVPRGLAAVVTRCLAKRPEDRFATYSALAKELEPSSSTAPKPASVGLRTAAGVIDWFVVGGLLTPAFVGLRWGALDSGSTLMALRIASIVLTAMYFGVSESRWGASAGKALCGLRVVGADQVKPNLGPALLRGLLFAVAVRIVEVFVAPGEVSTHPGVFTQISVGIDISFGMGFRFPRGRPQPEQYLFMGIVLLFITARRRNGFAGMHDLWSHTRVVMTPDVAPRPATRAAPEATGPRTEVARIGPFQVLEHLDAGVVLAYDGRLRRRVWIRRLTPGTPALTGPRRDLSRPSRLHWLTGTRTADECWDAYEAADGAPLATQLDTPHEWSQVRVWLRDLAAELDEGLKDDTLPDLALDRVWITADGRAMLLDWPAPGPRNVEVSKIVESAPASERSARLFLRTVADSALARHDLDAGATSLPLPLSARRLLHQLSAPTSSTLAQLRAALYALVAAPSVVSRRKRWVHLGICGVLPLIFYAYLIPMFLTAVIWAQGPVPTWDLRIAVQQLAGMPRPMNGTSLSQSKLEQLGFESADAARVVLALETYVAGQFQLMDISPSEWIQPFMRPSWRTVAQQAVTAHPSPSPAELEAAEVVVRPFLMIQEAQRSEPTTALDVIVALSDVVATPTMFLLPVVALSLLLAAPFRGGLLLRMVGIAVVTRSGAETSRARALARAAISWGPLVPTSAMHLMQFVDLFAGRPLTELPDWWPALVIPWLVGVVWAAWDPQRGLQDRLAGTYLVPR